MIMNIIVILLVLGVAYAWMVRGVFNALLHMLCAIVAGAVAFAFWEPLALMMINASPERGFLSFLESVAWGAGLLIPFVVALLLLRVITDKAIPNNINNNTAVDYAGGAICGLVTGVITAGVVVIGVGNMRLPTNFFGYQPVWYSADRAKSAGSLVEGKALWIPADKLVAKIYGGLSGGSMATAEPLAKWYPELELTGFASRLSPSEGAGRNAVKPDDFSIKSSYTVGDALGGSKVSELLSDAQDSNSQKYIDIKGEPVTTGRLVGYIIEFEPGAKERGDKGGQIVVSNGQFRLLAQNNEGQTRNIFPVAIISESSEAGQFGRWRFDSPDVFIRSTGGQSRVPMAFEFVVPQGYQPQALYVKNVRVDVTSLPKATAYESTTQRDRLVRTGSILKGGQAEKTRELDTSRQITINPDENRSLISKNLRLIDMLSTQAVKRSMSINGENQLTEGEGTFDVKLEVGRNNVPVSRNLRVERYAVGSGQELMKVDVGPDSPFGLLSDAARDAPIDQPFLLIDTNGNEYEAIGFEYKDRELLQLRFTRGSTLTGIQDTPAMSTSRDDQSLTLLFIVTSGAKITNFTVGDTSLARFTPPVD